MSTIAKTASGSGAPRRVRGEPFFYYFAIMMTAVVFSGFIINAIVNHAEIERFTAWIALHGLFSAVWYLLLINQLRLVRAGNLAAHRRMGKLSLLLFAGFLVSGVVMTVDLYQFVSSNPEFDLNDPSVRMGAGQAIGGIFLQWVLATVIFALGLLNIRRPTHHKRFMIATSIQMAPAAVTRWLGLFALPGPLALPVLLLFYLVLVAYDWRSERRIHWSTLVSLGIFMLLPLSFFFLFTQQWWGDLVVGVLGGWKPPGN